MGSKNNLASFKEDFSLMIEAGFVAVKQCDERSARQIFKAAQILSPKSVAPEIGLGYIALNKMQLKESDAIFEDVVKKEPNNLLASAFLGISYVLQKAKRKKGIELLENARDKSDEATVKNLAEITLKWIVKDLEKKESKAPFFQQGKKKEEKVK